MQVLTWKKENEVYSTGGSFAVTITWLFPYSQAKTCDNHEHPSLPMCNSSDATDSDSSMFPKHTKDILNQSDSHVTENEDCTKLSRELMECDSPMSALDDRVNVDENMQTTSIAEVLFTCQSEDDSHNMTPSDMVTLTNSLAQVGNKTLDALF